MDLRERIAGLMGRVRPELAELVAIQSVADPGRFKSLGASDLRHWPAGCGRESPLEG
jgi:hypothetical protein